ncbi:MAG: hypothetical protein WCS87_14880 [Methylococcaceae bacterium]
MKNNRLALVRVIFGLIVYISSIGGTQAANSLSLIAGNPTVTAGSQATFELWMDFSGDPTLGGGVDVIFDNFINGNQLSFSSYTPEILGDTFLIDVPIVNMNGKSLDRITFGDFTNGLEGSALVGTLVFDTLVAGNFNLSLIDSVDAGGFFSISGTPQVPAYISANLTVTPSAVPIPATAWLMLSGLIGMAYKSKAKQA